MAKSIRHTSTLLAMATASVLSACMSQPGVTNVAANGRVTVQDGGIITLHGTTVQLKEDRVVSGGGGSVTMRVLDAGGSKAAATAAPAATVAPTTAPTAAPTTAPSAATPVAAASQAPAASASTAMTVTAGASVSSGATGAAAPSPQVSGAAAQITAPSNAGNGNANGGGNAAAATSNAAGAVASTPAPIAMPSPGPVVPAAVAGFGITYVAQTAPILVGDVVIQADDIIISGSRAYIAYNVQGAGFRGAIQILDISDPNHPTILKTVRFTDLKVDSLCLDGNRLLFGGGANPDAWNFHAFIGSVDLANVDAVNILKSLKGLPSYATTAIKVVNGRCYAGVGAKDGGVAILDHDLKQTAFIPDADVRGLDAYNDGVIALAGTTDSTKGSPTLDVIGTSLISQTPIHAFMHDYAKANLALTGTKLWTALSSSGLNAWDMTKPTTAPIYGLSNPTDSDLMTTNSVSSDGTYVFTANGEYGFRVVKMDGGARDNAFAHVVGYHEMTGDAYGGQHYSANQLVVGGDFLFVASGVGAVNIYHLERNGAGTTPSASPGSDKDKEKDGTNRGEDVNNKGTGENFPVRIDKVSPSIALPGTVMYVYGDNLDSSDVHVKIADRDCEVLERRKDRITVKVPADAPQSDDEKNVSVTHGGKTTTSGTGVHVTPGGNDFGTNVSNASAGLHGNVYRLETNTAKLPTDLATRKPDGDVIAANIDTSPRDFTAGFPGLSGKLLEWFALRFTGKITPSVAGNTMFSLLSDDGSKLYIDDALVIDNDGAHVAQSKDGQVNLTQGAHKFKLEYFQGPRYRIALQLFWQQPGKAKEIVPASAFTLDEP